MSVKRYCSLCCTSCTEYEFLQNDAGESNNTYEITVKYFDPMLLTDAKYAQVLCTDCWFHIKDFHEYQQTVLKARMLFEDKKSTNILCTDVKQEDSPGIEAINVQDSEKLYITEIRAIFNNDDVDSEYFKAESSKTFEFGQEEIQKEPENVKYTSKHHHHINSSTTNTDTTTSTNDENTPNPPIAEQNRDKIALEQNKTTNKYELPIKTRRGRKPKCANNNKSVKPYTSAVEGDENKQETPKIKITKGKEGSSLNLRKARELDAFIAEWKPELICDLCSETTNNFDQLRSHFKQKHKIKFYIKCCEKKFFRRYVFANHIQLHLDPDTHKCEICGKSSSSKKNLKLHKKLMHELTKQLKCDICEKLFKQKVTLARHLLTHSTGSKDFVCSECGKGFVAEQLLKLHIKHVHNADRICDQCGKTIHGFQTYKKHLMEHAGIERVKFTCDVCDQKFTTSNGLKKHKAAYHNDGSTIYVCGVCGKVAASENALMNHKRLVHVKERRHKCTYCEKAFKRPLALREHIASHTGEDLYQCPHCPQTFKVSSNMHHHRKKVHPVEWEEGRKNRLQQPKININQVKKQVVI